MTLRFFCCLATMVGASTSLAQRLADTHTWAQVKSFGRGTIVVHWSESKPFIFRNSLGQMRGIEPDILEGFRKFLKKNYHVELQIQWLESADFESTYAAIRDRKQVGSFGASAFSITSDREKEVDFSLPYMSDISVMITSKDIPIVQSAQEFDQVFSKLTAITITGTTYEQDLLKLRKREGIPFKIQYIHSSQNILRAIEARDGAFGFIDLPVYMMVFNNNPTVHVRRQNLFPIKREGYAFIYPKSSDWAMPLGEYFYDENFKSDLEKIIGQYLDIELYHFIESLAIRSNDPVILLTKEKEIQDKDLLGKSQQIAQEARTRTFLLVFAALILVFMAVIFGLYQKRNQQKREIETQRKNIELKSLELEERNQHLVALNEEKNSLIKILAHDLRTPINHVQGLAQVFLLSNRALPDEQKTIIQDIIDASVRLNKMISNILDIDAVENDRVRIFMDEVPIAELVKRVVKSFDKQALRKNIHLSFTTPHETCRINGDALFLTQVFENLLSNAIKFSEPGKSVETSLTCDGPKVLVTVKDHGPGISEEDLPSLFKKFQKLTSRPTGGESSTGLGLSIVKKYVELMGGRVWCESKPFEGATFFVEFNKV